jgi:ABC-type uncharacterized transport system substrate-binding protein
MNNKILSRFLLTTCLLLLLLGTAQCRPGIQQRANTSPRLRPDGQKWRIGYYEAGYYIDYEENLRALISGLAELDWIEPLQIPELKEDNDRILWDYLVLNVQSDYLEFIPDGFWSADWQEDQRRLNREDAIQRLNKPGEMDLMIAMGTWAGQDLANDRHSVATMVLNSSGPLEAGIIQDYRDSGYNHVMVEVDPNRYKRQIEQFHDIVNFDRLGVAYEDSPDGRIYSNIADLEAVASARGFTLVVCKAPDIKNEVSQKDAAAALAACYASLAPKIDALWMGAHAGEEPQYLPQVLEPLFEHHVATWSQFGEPAVRRGVLLSIAQQDYEDAGRWYSRSMAQIFNGTPPRKINQIFELPTHLLINLETARRIGFEIPPGLLAAADKTFPSIESDGGRE